MFDGCVWSIGVLPCFSSPCHNDGACHDDVAADTFVCSCLPIYTGRTCQTGHVTVSVNVCKVNSVSVGMIRIARWRWQHHGIFVRSFVPYYDAIRYIYMRAEVQPTLNLSAETVW